MSDVKVMIGLHTTHPPVGEQTEIKYEGYARQPLTDEFCLFPECTGPFNEVHEARAWAVYGPDGQMLLTGTIDHIIGVCGGVIPRMYTPNMLTDLREMLPQLFGGSATEPEVKYAGYTQANPTIEREPLEGEPPSALYLATFSGKSEPVSYVEYPRLPASPEGKAHVGLLFAEGREVVEVPFIPPITISSIPGVCTRCGGTGDDGVGYSPCPPCHGTGFTESAGIDDAQPPSQPSEPAPNEHQMVEALELAIQVMQRNVMRDGKHGFESGFYAAIEKCQRALAGAQQSAEPVWADDARDGMRHPEASDLSGGETDTQPTAPVVPEEWRELAKRVITAQDALMVNTRMGLTLWDGVVERARALLAAQSQAQEATTGVPVSGNIYDPASGGVA